MGVKVLTERLLATFGSGRGQSVKVRLVDFEGVGLRLDIRRHFTDEHGTESPTQKGIALKPEWIAQLRHALHAFECEVAKEARE